MSYRNATSSVDKCVSVSLLLTDQKPDSGNPLLICCHAVVLGRIVKEDTEHLEYNSSIGCETRWKYRFLKKRPV